MIKRIAIFENGKVMLDISVAGATSAHISNHFGGQRELMITRAKSRERFALAPIATAMILEETE